MAWLLNPLIMQLWHAKAYVIARCKCNEAKVMQWTVRCKLWMEWWGAPPPVIIACYVSGSERVERFRERIFWYLVRILYYFWHVAECEEKCLLVTFFTFPLLTCWHGLPLALHWRCSYFEGNKENDLKVGSWKSIRIFLCHCLILSFVFLTQHGVATTATVKTLHKSGRFCASSCYASWFFMGRIASLLPFRPTPASYTAMNLGLLSYNELISQSKCKVGHPSTTMNKSVMSNIWHHRKRILSESLRNLDLLRHARASATLHSFENC